MLLFAHPCYIQVVIFSNHICVTNLNVQLRRNVQLLHMLVNRLINYQKKLGVGSFTTGQ